MRCAIVLFGINRTRFSAARAGGRHAWPVGALGVLARRGQRPENQKREGDTMRFLCMGALAVALAAVPAQQASATGYSRFTFGFNICWEHYGQVHERMCFCYRGHGHQPNCLPFMPGLVNSQAQSGQWEQAPPPTPDGRLPDRREDETILQWGYPGLGYSYHHPVSYYAPQQPQAEAPTYYYYTPPPYYPAYGTPSYYQTPGITFDR